MNDREPPIPNDSVTPSPCHHLLILNSSLLLLREDRLQLSKEGLQSFDIFIRLHKNHPRLVECVRLSPADMERGTSVRHISEELFTQPWKWCYADPHKNPFSMGERA